MKPVAIFFALPILLASGFCYGDEISAKLSDTSFYVETTDGRPSMCGVQFRIFYADQFNRSSGLSQVSGSLVWLEDQGRILFLEKISGADIQSKQLVPFQVASAFLSYDGETTPAKRLPGGCTGDTAAFCGAYVDESAIGALASVYESTFSVSFRRKDSLVDTVVRLDLTSASQDEERRKSFNRCTDAVMEPITRNLRQRSPNQRPEK
ncbi:hypothetical protein JQ617_29260 [Bradyrhizobium sp. KB893862 SZCCT0404]|uniref:hypothetical protein n=1 Tax=Bradyrhizobium sp. KB893862 SZCCT0404 TaxID=2807672 RepID=UPI001BA6695E|nr:hypothetical protein [Bradyrhizobium sp. KB893862 SZCCT0404]MBR1178081.1 hypothetical protein [Bradyrhizobium sp. KB893862 SZCCT0404]